MARGRTITITRHGRPVAGLVPVAGGDGGADEVGQAIKQARAKVTLGDLDIADLIQQGRQ